ncbi:ABC transporter permease subunit [Salmonella enterica]|nr:ABC transporter permease subunit [Salmonella enterica]
MRLFNWRRQAILHAMPVVKPDQIRTPWREFWRRFRRQHVALVAGGFVLALILVAIFSIPAFARLVRGNTLVLKQQTFIESARSIGASDTTILFSHILPGTVSSIVVFFTMRIGTSIISAASLSFLGLGAQPPTPEWGAMLNEARADMVIAPHVALFPAVAIFLTVLAFNLLGDGLRDALDPKIKG